MIHRVTVLLSYLLIVGLTLSACNAGGFSIPTVQFGQTQASGIIETIAPIQSLPPTPTSTPIPLGIWVSRAIPENLRKVVESWDIPLVETPGAASLHLDMVKQPVLDGGTASWIYALVTPFPTIVDDVTGEELREAWNRNQPGSFANQPILMDKATLETFTALWGVPATGSVRTVEADQIMDTAWAHQPSWAIIPFEALEPRWKVLSVDGQSPLHNDFEPGGYPLVSFFSIKCSEPCPVSPLPTLPATNRDPSKLTVLVMTGVTALVRATAFTMEIKGITYPGLDVGDWLRYADIAHISNEIPFDPDCPSPNPNESKLIFCSDPRYIGLLEDIGTDVIELTGNHFQDRGSQATLDTLEMYKERDWIYYGGGANLEDAIKPRTMEHNGNKLAFIGCNPAGPSFAWATENQPGAAPCDYHYMVEQIQLLRAQGYLPIASFQYQEYYSPEPRPWQQRDFRLLADAGAVVVSGSQAHFAQAMEFYHGSFIHYGLGNLFFDQMNDEGTRREFLDRHIFYDGRYIGTELLTAMLVDYCRPLPMTKQERGDFLTFIFDASGWGSNFPTPTPTLTLTLTPMKLPIYTTPSPTNLP